MKTFYHGFKVVERVSDFHRELTLGAACVGLKKCGCPSEKSLKYAFKTKRIKNY